MNSLQTAGVGTSRLKSLALPKPHGEASDTYKMPRLREREAEDAAKTAGQKTSAFGRDPASRLPTQREHCKIALRACGSAQPA